MTTRTESISIEDTLRQAYAQERQRPAAPAAANDDDDAQESEHSEEELTVPHEDEHTSNMFDSPEECIEDDEFDDEALEAEIYSPAEDKGVRARRWFITYFTDNIWKPDFNQVPSFRYAVYTREICPSTQRVHYHCYLELTNPNTMQWVKNRLDVQSANLQVCKGTVKQNIMYCTKKRTRFPGFTPVHVGNPSEQGNRTDLDWIAEAILQGATHHELLVAGRGNIFRYGNMVNLAQKTVNSENDMDLMIVYNRWSESQGLKRVTLRDIRSNEDIRAKAVELNMQSMTKSTAPPDVQHALSYVALGHSAGNTPKQGKAAASSKPAKAVKEKPSEEAKALRQAVKKEQAKAVKVKSYKKPLGAYFSRIRDDLDQRIIKFVNEYLESNPINDFKSTDVEYMELFSEALTEFVETTIVQYCDDPSDAAPLHERLLTLIQEHFEDAEEHILATFEQQSDPDLPRLTK